MKGKPLEYHYQRGLVEDIQEQLSPVLTGDPVPDRFYIIGRQITRFTGSQNIVLAKEVYDSNITSCSGGLGSAEYFTYNEVRSDAP